MMSANLPEGPVNVGMVRVIKTLPCALKHITHARRLPEMGWSEYPLAGMSIPHGLLTLVWLFESIIYH